MNSRSGALLTLLLLSACSGNPPPQQGYLPPSVAAAVPAALVTPAETGEIGPGDALAVIVFREPDLSLASVTVDALGNIQLPLLGERHAAGTTPAALGAGLQRDLGRYVVAPRVTVNILTSNSRRVTVEGEVAQPGIYAFQGGMTLLSAVALARGPTPVASTEQVGVLRTTAEGRYLGVFDLRQIRAGRAADVTLQPGDTIIVQRSGRRQFWRDFIQTAPILGLFARI